jgi:transposase
VTKKTKPNYNKEFIEDAVKLVISSEKPTAQIARELGVKSATLYSWVNKEKESDAVEDISKAELFDELKQLKKELRDVKEQRDILKKATAYFAKESQ